MSAFRSFPLSSEQDLQNVPIFISERFHPDSSSEFREGYRSIRRATVAATIPPLNEIRRRYSGHFVASEFRRQEMRSHDVIVAYRRDCEVALAVLGSSLLLEYLEGERWERPSLFAIPVASLDELMYLLAEIREHVGFPDTTGGRWWFEVSKLTAREFFAKQPWGDL
ncbi:MAG TPA: hypothetical protein VGN57_07105 [Pirellulaceae bacterium]|jgi:hypothetical protein|nr:hypothetical protein [Pirellulaceae bacterium]